MEDLIKREDAIKAVSNDFDLSCQENIYRLISNCIEDIKNIPAVEEKIGFWDERYMEDENPFFRRRFYCSYCGDWNTYGKPKYCPNCGAKMEK